MSENNFGLESNGKICSCGAHHGVGEWSPERRAAVAKRMQDRMPGIMSSEQKTYLKDWESKHGPVAYRMGVVGKNGGDFDKNAKGRDIIGPVYIDLTIPIDDMFSPKQRADIHG